MRGSLSGNPLSVSCCVWLCISVPETAYVSHVPGSDNTHWCRRGLADLSISGVVFGLPVKKTLRNFEGNSQDPDAS